MDLPDGYRLRAPTEDDLDAIETVLAADDVDDVGEPVLNADFVREGWSIPGFDLTLDAWVIVDAEGIVVAYGHTQPEDPDIIESWGVVHPDHRGRGLGTALLDRIEARTIERLADPAYRRFHHAVNATDVAAAGMLEARGLRPVRHFWHMEIEVDAPFEEDQPPDGITIDGVGDGDLPAVHAVVDAAFAEHWGYAPTAFDRWAEQYTSGPSFDPSLWLLARDDGAPVGALTANVFGDRGWVAELGVLSSHRGRGVASALLRRSFAAFADRGVRRIMLNVDAENTTGATALYERVGMRVVKRWDVWERAHAG
jgi:mycothiol synthase